MSNFLDSDLGLNCLQKLSADGTSSHANSNLAWVLRQDTSQNFEILEIAFFASSNFCHLLLTFAKLGPTEDTCIIPGE